MVQNNKKSIKNSKGFTIVELLVVIVVIAILAAITIISYAGVTNRANTSSAQSAANNTMQKAAIYQAESTTSSWPATLATLTGAASTTTYALTGVEYAAMGTVNTNTTLPASTPTKPTNSYGVIYGVCGTGSTDSAPTSYATITAITGIKIYYWDYSASTNASPLTAGTISGTVGTKSVACAAAGS